MNRRIAIAVGVQVLLMLAVPIRPLWLRTTGTPVYLETEKMDPRDLLRGDYVILGYKVAQGVVPDNMAAEARTSGRPVYVTVTTDRPARFVAVSLEKPIPSEGQACLVGRARGWTGAIDFPQIAQFYVPEGTGHVIESRRGADLLAKAMVSDQCDAVLAGLEPR